MKKLLDFIESVNIADGLKPEKLVYIGQRVKRQYDEDMDSMREWSECVEKGIDLMKQEWMPKTVPWEKASNYKDPILSEASVRFGDKAKMEVLSKRELVTYKVKGLDPENQLKMVGERIAIAMNYQLDCDMPNWREEQEKLLYSLPNYGSVFKKTMFDSVTQKAEVTRICFPDFAINQSTESLEDARSFSHVFDVSRNTAVEKINSGIWIDYLEERKDKTRTDGDEGTNAEQEVLHAKDNNESFIEQHCFFDLDGDGYEEPYIVTICRKNCKVVRIVARYTEQTIFVDVNGQSMPLDQAIMVREEDVVSRMGGYQLLDLIGLQKPEDDLKDLKLIRIEPFNTITHYGFIPSPDGTFLNLGYPHLLGAITASINTATNQLTDSGSLDNLSGGFLSKEFRNMTGLIQLAPGEWKKTDVPAEKFARGIFPKPSQPPSQTLYNLLKDKTERAQGYLATLDISGQLTAETAPTTALAMLSEAAIPTSALISRFLDAETREFQILFKINQSTFPVEKYQKILRNPQVDPQMDFNDDLYIVPTANAEMSSKTQRLQAAMVGLEQFERVLQAGGNPVPLLRRYYEALDPEMAGEVFPDEGALSPKEKQQIEQMKQAQETQNQLQQLQLQALQREQERLDFKTQSEAQIDQAKVAIEEEKALIDRMSKQAKAVKDLADADSQTIENDVVESGITKIAQIINNK